MTKKTKCLTYKQAQEKIKLKYKDGIAELKKKEAQWDKEYTVGLHEDFPFNIYRELLFGRRKMLAQDLLFVERLFEGEK